MANNNISFKIRKSTKEDSFSIAHVVTVAWNETYKGIVPSWYLEELKTNEKERGQKLYNLFDENKNRTFVLQADDKVVGFVRYGLTEDEEFDKTCGEIFALYIIAKYKGYGFGKKLVSSAVNEIKNLGCNKMLIACLKGNPSNDFYKHMGGKYVKDGVFKKLNLPENVFLFKNI